MSSQCLMQIVHDMTLLQQRGLDYRQHPFHEAATGLAVTAERILPPQHTGAQDPLDMIVGRLDTLDCRE